MMIAAHKGFPSVVRTLYSAGVDVNEGNVEYKPLFLAAREGHLEVVRVLAASWFEFRRLEWIHSPA